MGLTTAVIGLGSMGWGAAVSLLRAGFPTAGVDIRETVLDDFRKEGGQTSSTPSEAAAGADIIFVFVVNAEQTDQVLFGENGAVAAAAPGSTFVLCVTMPPSYTLDVATRLTAAGMKVIDAPVSGGAAKALAGEMTIMASGAAGAFDQAGPALDAIASKVFRLGDDPGTGSRVKMINQLLAGVHIAAMGEALTMGIRSGLDARMLYEVIIECAGNSWMFENRGQHVVDGDYAPKSAVDIFVKDMGIVTSEGRAADFPLPLSETALSLFKEAQTAGYGREDDSAVAKVYAAKGGIALPGSSGK
ncbi:L-threonate dehydrogenase [Denitrobaculum tricleocarpae]|uniref:L-threonate dehydrogenase n=1 Tax=Denitrobaculum tricleocarpae TaxID=2591009 RepID=A0A545TWS0_9PROT|nr:L-threonate dehydrogenase [Denitrobaculum tricleocarpae]TQV81631.1 NAD(P)-dependent oxidoreductase [Denitrobaculum tricleocarpae]